MDFTSESFWNSGHESDRARWWHRDRCVQGPPPDNLKYPDRATPVQYFRTGSRQDHSSHHPISEHASAPDSGESGDSGHQRGGTSAGGARRTRVGTNGSSPVTEHEG